MRKNLFHFIRYQIYSKAICFSVIITLTALLSACSTTGDFGRPHKYLIQDYIVGTVMDIAIDDGDGLEDTVYEAKQKNYGVKFYLSQAEIALRDISLHYHQNLTGRRLGYDIETRPLAFAENLTASGINTPDARVDYIIHKIKADKIWLRYFVKTAEEVKNADARRLYIIDTRKRNLLKQDRIRTLARINENNQVIEHIFENLDQRLASYMYALDRSEVEIPGRKIFKARLQFKQLRKEIVLARAAYDKLSKMTARPFARMSKSRGIMRVEYRDRNYFNDKKYNSKMSDPKINIPKMNNSRIVREKMTSNKTKENKASGTQIRNWFEDVKVKKENPIP